MDTSIPVSEVMTRQVVHVRPDTAIDELHAQFEKNTFHHIPVLDHGRLVGIISRSDYHKVRHVLAITWEGLTIVQDIYRDMTVSDIMTPNPLQVESSDSIGLAADIFKANTLHALPVVDDGELVGIITSHDLLNYAFQGML